MFKKRNLIFFCLLILGVFLISGCWLISTPAYTVTYDGNGHTGGSVPIDSTVYKEDDIVTVLGKGDLVKTGYTFAGWNTAADGSGTDHAVGSTFIMGLFDVTFYTKWTFLYALCDTGPAGGYIFYDKGGYSNGWRYLEAAPTDQSTAAAWGTRDYTVAGADDTAIGTGKQNTLDIIADDSAINKAADICDNYSIENGGITYDDWFLPSQDELNQMYDNLYSQGFGGFADVYYWSSSEYGAEDAWVQNFNGGGQGNYPKDGTTRVRAVRAF